MLWLHLELCAVPPCCRVVTLTVPPGSEPHFLKLLSHPLLTLSHFFLLEIFLTGWETFFRLLCLRIALFCRHMWLIICQFTESWNSNTPVFFCFAFVFIFVFFFFCFAYLEPFLYWSKKANEEVCASDSCSGNLFVYLEFFLFKDLLRMSLKFQVNENFSKSWIWVFIFLALRKPLKLKSTFLPARQEELSPLFSAYTSGRTVSSFLCLIDLSLMCLYLSQVVRMKAPPLVQSVLRVLESETHSPSLMLPTESRVRIKTLWKEQCFA